MCSGPEGPPIHVLQLESREAGLSNFQWNPPVAGFYLRPM